MSISRAIYFTVVGQHQRTHRIAISVLNVPNVRFITILAAKFTVIYCRFLNLPFLIPIYLTSSSDVIVDYVTFLTLRTADVDEVLWRLE